MRAAVLGSPIAHSKSPALHRAAYAAAGLDWRYDAIDVTAAQLPGFLAGLTPEWAGLSLTMPLKTAVIALLPELSAAAATTSSVNTVVFPTAPGAGTSDAASGVAKGFNTDVDGIVAAVLELSPAARGAPGAAVLGAGATARSAVVALAELGVGDVHVYARRPAAAEELASWAARVGIVVRPGRWSRAAEGLRQPLVISTVPSGGADALAASVVGPDGTSARSVDAAPRTLLDVVYDPWPTPLARAWRAAGGVVVPGLAMLVHQAAVQVRLMTGVEADVGAMKRAVGL
jgi:shikimate dehydrogenase